MFRSTLAMTGMRGTFVGFAVRCYRADAVFTRNRIPKLEIDRSSQNHTRTMSRGECQSNLHVVGVVFKALILQTPPTSTFPATGDRRVYRIGEADGLDAVGNLC